MVAQRTFIHSFIHSFIHPSIHPPIPPSVHPCIRPSVRPSIFPSIKQRYTHEHADFVPALYICICLTFLGARTLHSADCDAPRTPLHGPSGREFAKSRLDGTLSEAALTNTAMVVIAIITVCAALPSWQQSRRSPTALLYTATC